MHQIERVADISSGQFERERLAHRDEGPLTLTPARPRCHLARVAARERFFYRLQLDVTQAKRWPARGAAPAHLALPEDAA